MRVVLVRLSALGDIVHTWPLAVELRKMQPRMHLTWVVEEPLRPLVEGHPAVDTVLTAATKSWRHRPLSADTRSRLSVLRSRFHELQPDLAVDPQGVLKSALVTRLTGAPRRIGLARPWRRERIAGLAYTSTVAGSHDQRHVVATNIQLARAAGADPSDTLPYPDGRWLLQKLSDRPPVIAPQPGYVALLPGAGRPDKILPVEDLSAVARWSVDRGFRAVVLWGPDEEQRARAVVEAAGPGTELAPPTDLDELVLTLGHARAVVGGDTGPVHLAASLEVPTMAIFTTTDWRRNGPLGPAVAVVSGAELDDGGPTGSSAAKRPGTVTAEQIIVGLRRLLESSEPSPPPTHPAAES